MTYDGYTKYDARVAGNYDADRQGEEHWRAEQQFVAAYVSRSKLGQVLDMPVGTGRFFEYYSSADAVTGVDISPDMLIVAKAKAATSNVPGLRLLRGDAVALPFPDNSFDTSICFRLAHLLPPDVVPGLFKDLARVSKGRVLVQVYAARERAASPLAPLRSLARRVLSPARQPDTKPWSHIQSYAHTLQFLIDAAAGGGLTLIKHHVLCSYGNDSVDVLELQK